MKKRWTKQDEGLRKKGERILAEYIIKTNNELISQKIDEIAVMKAQNRRYRKHLKSL